jgi:hypothetical protein
MSDYTHLAVKIFNTWKCFFDCQTIGIIFVSRAKIYQNTEAFDKKKTKQNKNFE